MPNKQKKIVSFRNTKLLGLLLLTLLLVFCFSPTENSTLESGVTYISSTSDAFAPVTNWDYLIGLGASTNQIEEAVLNHATGKCEAKRNGKLLKSKSGKLSHITLDMHDTSPALIKKLKAENVKVICYTSIGTIENFRKDGWYEKVQSAGLSGGSVSKMDGSSWRGENWVKKASSPVFKSYLDSKFEMAKSKGCDGIEFDNLDGSEKENQKNSKLSSEENIKLISLINTECGKNKEINCGFKNALEIAQKAPINNFSFLMNERCFQFKECDQFKNIFKDKPILNVEYEERFGKTDQQLLHVSRGKDEMTDSLPALLKSCLNLKKAPTPTQTNPPLHLVNETNIEVNKNLESSFDLIDLEKPSSNL